MSQVDSSTYPRGCGEGEVGAGGEIHTTVIDDGDLVHVNLECGRCVGGRCVGVYGHVCVGGHVCVCVCVCVCV